MAKLNTRNQAAIRAAELSTFYTRVSSVGLAAHYSKRLGFLKELQHTSCLREELSSFEEEKKLKI